MPPFETMDELITALSTSDRATRLAAARSLGELYLRSDDQFPYAPPPWRETLTHLFHADEGCPGVADTFWDKVQFDCPDFGATGAWMLAVLKQRGPLAQLNLPNDLPVDLEFHVHEAFDGNQAVLRDLLDRGFDDLVVMTLEHDALTKADHKALCDALIATGRDAAVGGAVLALLYTSGVIHEEALKRGIITEHHVKKDKPAISVDYKKAGNSSHFFIFSRDQNNHLSVDELKEVLDALLPAQRLGAEISREAAKQDPRFWLIPEFPHQVQTRFHANGYVVSTFDFSKAAPSIRVELPKDHAEDSHAF